MNPTANRPTRQEHINAFVTAFVKNTKKARYLEFLSDQKRRHRILERLNHNLAKDLKPENILRHQPDTISMLVRKEDITAYLIADDKELDDRFLPLMEALRALLSSHFGVIISIIPGKLAVYKAESPSGTIWLVQE
jgi:hypothetical protein